MCPQKDFPRYDDMQHIDSNATAKKAPTPRERAPMQDPTATAYTEMYCANDYVIDPLPAHSKQ